MIRHVDTPIRSTGFLVEITGHDTKHSVQPRVASVLGAKRHRHAHAVPVRTPQAIAFAVKRDARPDILINAHVQSDADQVRCDVHLFETVLKNLLYNATRYARHEIRLLVDDDGPGVPEQDRQRVFESFVQLDRAAGRKTGFGLGLAIVKRAMDWHGGDVAISQAPLGGARFCATWPAEPYDGRSGG